MTVVYFFWIDSVSSNKLEFSNFLEDDYSERRETWFFSGITDITVTPWQT